MDTRGRAFLYGLLYLLIKTILHQPIYRARLNSVELMEEVDVYASSSLRRSISRKEAVADVRAHNGAKDVYARYFWIENVRRQMTQRTTYL